MTGMGSACSAHTIMQYQLCEDASALERRVSHAVKFVCVQVSRSRVSSHIGTFCHGASASRNLRRRHYEDEGSSDSTFRPSLSEMTGKETDSHRDESSALLAELVGVRRLRIALAVTAARFWSTGHALAICELSTEANARYSLMSAR